MLECALERDGQVGFVERLADEVGRAELHRLDDGARAALSGKKNDRHIAVDLFEGRECCETIHATRHHHVEDDRSGALLVVEHDRLLGGAHRRRLVPATLEEASQVRAHVGVVVDDEDRGAIVAGRVCGKRRFALRLVHLHWHDGVVEQCSARAKSGAPL